MGEPSLGGYAQTQPPGETGTSAVSAPVSDRAGQAVSVRERAQQAFAAVAKDRMMDRQRLRSTYVPTPGESYLLGKMEEAKRTRLATLEAFEPIWTRSILYTAAVQHLQYVSAQRQWTPQKYDDWMPQPVVNIIQPKVQRIVDFFTRNKAKATVQPNTNEQDDIDAAKHGEYVLDHLWELNKTNELYNEAAHWMVICGNVFKRNMMDNSANLSVPTTDYRISKEPLMDERTGKALLGADGQPVMTERVQEPELFRQEREDGQGQQDGQGQRPQQVRSEIYGPMHYTVPLASTDFADGPWNMMVGMYPLHRIRTMFPDKAKYIGDQGRLIVSDLYQHRILSLLTSGVHGVIRSLDPYIIEGYAVVYQYEMQPDPEFPTGLNMIVMDDIPLYIGELPLRTRYSTEHCGYYKVPARFWYRGMVEDLLHIQDQINKLEQILQLNDAFNTNPMILVPSQAGIAEGELNNRPGLVVRYTYPFKPEFQDGVSMPAQIIQRRAIYMEDAEEISGVRHVLVGDAPGGVKAGVALNRLGEEAEGIFAPITKMWESFVGRCEQSKLEFVQLYYTLPQHITVQSGRGNLTHIKDFVGALLRGNTRVRVEPGSYKPRSLTDKQERIIELMGMGLLPGVMQDPEQNRQFLELMGIDDAFQSEQSLDYKRARMENELLKKPVSWQRVNRNSGDNDVVHLMVHTMERKKPAFENLPNVVQQRYVMHEMDHLLAIISAGGLEESDMLVGQDEQGGQDVGALGGSEESQPGTNGDQTNPSTKNKNQKVGGGERNANQAA